MHDVASPSHMSAEMYEGACTHSTRPCKACMKTKDASCVLITCLMKTGAVILIQAWPLVRMCIEFLTCVCVPEPYYLSANRMFNWSKQVRKWPTWPKSSSCSTVSQFRVQLSGQAALDVRGRCAKGQKVFTSGGRMSWMWERIKFGWRC